MLKEVEIPLITFQEQMNIFNKVNYKTPLCLTLLCQTYWLNVLNSAKQCVIQTSYFKEESLLMEITAEIMINFTIEFK